jgi:hypothetical protein
MIVVRDLAAYNQGKGLGGKGGCGITNRPVGNLNKERNPLNCY